MMAAFELVQRIRRIIPRKMFSDEAMRAPQTETKCWRYGEFAVHSCGLEFNELALSLLQLSCHEFES
jgi:hypothetical protein